MELRDLKVDMYFRTKAGTINKIDSFTEDKSEFYFDTKPIFSDSECLGSKWGYTKDIIKASDKLIDLVEAGDYVNGSEVQDFYREYNREIDDFKIKGVVTENCYLEDTDAWIIEKNIKTIVTKEMFEQMSYKVGE